MNPDGRPHPQHTAEKVLARLERDEQIIELTRRGKAVRVIAREVGCDLNTVLRTRKRSIAEAQDYMFADVRMYVAESLERLSALLDAIWDAAMAGNIKALTEARLIISAMGDFTGAKAPVRHDFGESDVDRALREMDAVLNRRVAEAAREAADVEGEARRG